MPRILFALLTALFLLPQPVQAASKGYEILFDAKNQWLNSSRALTSEDASGRMVLLDFWTYGCINCMQIVPDLKKLEKEFGDKLLVVGVHSAKFSGEKGSERILSAAKRFGLEHPVINDSNFDVWDRFDVEAWPTQILLDGKGEEVARYRGEGHYDEIKSDIAKHIGDAKPESKTTLAALKAADEKTGTLKFPARLGFGSDTPWGEILFVADSGNNRIIGATLDGKIKVTIGSGTEGAGDGEFATASFNHPRGFGVVKGGIYIADTNNHLIRYADFATGKVTTVAGTGKQGYSRDAKDDKALETPMASPWDVEMLQDGKTLSIAMAGTHQLWTLDTTAKTVSVLAGTGKEFIDDGNADESSLSQPSGLAPFGDTLYFVDAETSSLRKLEKSQVKTLIGTGLFDFGLVDGAYPKAMMQHAQGLDVDAGRVVIADTYNNTLRLYDIASGKLSTANIEKDALDEPGDVLQLNGKMYVADTNHHRVAVFDPKTGKTSTLTLAAAK